MSTPVSSSLPAPSRDRHRAAAADRLLTSLEGLIGRHRALALQDDELGLHAELISAEVAHELALTRSTLTRYPSLRSAG
jgi:hypothetical protein